MLKTDTIDVYYKAGVSFVALGNNTYFSVSDDGQKRSIVKDLPCDCIRSRESADNNGLTGSHARSLIATARQVAQVMQELSKQTKKGD